MKTETGSESTKDPNFHAANIRRMLHDVAEHARQDGERVEEPKAQALFETTSEVLRGLVTAYDHYQGQSEKAMRH